jgi:5,10-methylenetetrahydrofolate reductase
MDIGEDVLPAMAPAASDSLFLHQLVQAPTRATFFQLAAANTDKAEGITARIREKRDAATRIQTQLATDRHVLDEFAEAQDATRKIAQDIESCTWII